MNAALNKSAHRHPALRAFTLVELLVTLGLLSMIMIGITYGHIMGLKLYELVKAKITAAEMSRRTLNDLVADVRVAKSIQVGDGDSTTFTEKPPDGRQEGGAIQVYFDVLKSNYTRYYLNTNTSRLFKLPSSSTQPELIAECITNRVIFAVEDSQGNVITNSRNNCVVSLTLQFYQIQYPITVIRPGAYYDFFQLRTKITRRMHE
ncbi:MAG: prepilin-type N-terminal cleavage/methylation domain-containing protein [Verrucomicrobiota bacterium]